MAVCFPLHAQYELIRANVVITVQTREVATIFGVFAREKKRTLQKRIFTMYFFTSCEKQSGAIVCEERLLHVY